MSEFIKNKKVALFLLLSLIIVILVQNIDINYTDFNSEHVIVDNRESNSVNDNCDRQPELPKTADSSTNLIQIISKNDTLVRKDGLNQTIEFYFNDTINNTPISNLTTNDIVVKDNQTISGDFKIRTGGNGDHNWTLYNMTGKPGYYRLNVSIEGLDSGWVKLEINATISNNSSVAWVNFYLRGNSTRMKLIWLAYYDFVTKLNYISCFIGSNITIHFTLVDEDYYNKSVIDRNLLAHYLTIFNKTDSSNIEGTLSNDINYDSGSKEYHGTIYTYILSNLGNYLINLTISLPNYENIPFIFAVFVLEKYQVNVSATYKPMEVLAGEFAAVSIVAKYIYGRSQFVIAGANINLTFYINGKFLYETIPQSTDNNGTTIFYIIIPINAIHITFDVKMEGGYYYKFALIKNMEITVIPFSRLLLSVILYIGAIVGIVIYSYSIYRDEILYKKLEKKGLLTKIKTLIDEALNLENIFILHKDTGECILFKSFSLDENDLIKTKELISIVISFGTERKFQEVINEIIHDDKVILINDGKYTRISLILGNRPTIETKNHLKNFTDSFENNYKHVLENWKGHLDDFKNVEQLIDEIFNTSFIVPHEISREYSSIEYLKIPYSKELLKITEELERYPDRRYYFISTLLKEAKDKYSKDLADFFVKIKNRNFFFISTLMMEAFGKVSFKSIDIFDGINELKEKGILKPIEISTIQTTPISQQELNLLSQYFTKNENSTSEEKNKFIKDLEQKCSVERDIYISCLISQHKIISPPIESTITNSLLVNNFISKSK